MTDDTIDTSEVFGPPPTYDDNGLPSDLDPECYNLCLALNSYPGIRTTCSCCGHGDRPFHVWFATDDLDSLPAVLYWFDGCHSGFYDWRVIVETDCGMSPAFFLVEGPIGEDGYRQADEIAELMTANRDGLVCPACGKSTWRKWDDDESYCESCDHRETAKGES